jgi:GNAT superfamily N-acetyltransferase
MTPPLIQTLTGAAITPHLPALARLRITVFRDWPYLYDGDAAYEENYLQIYNSAPRAMIVFAFDGETIIGASTCLPLADETSNVQAPFAANGIDVSNVFYFGESVLLKTYRGHGLGVKFFAAREAHARSFNTYTTAAFCAVQRPESHPLRPPTFTPLDDFWTHRGYTKQPQLQCKMSWQDLNETIETEKTLTFWTKPL